MNIRKKKQKHIKNNEIAHKPTLRQTIRQLLKMFARRKEIPIPEGYSRLEDVLARSKARREEKYNADNE